MHRRTALKLSAAMLATSLPGAASAFTAAPAAPREEVEQWGLFEVVLQGPTTGNPFRDVVLTAQFTQGHRVVAVKGFYDGEGVYRLRFMPDALGHWSYTTASTTAALNGRTGLFTCIAASAGNHGPVTTAHRFHFAYADGTPYFPFGTTTYAYLFTSDTDATDSLKGMRGMFNKTRACVLPKPLGQGPQILPFPVTSSDAQGQGGANDYTRFNPAYFHLVEKRILELQAAGLEADCILFHPYDAWGYKAMPNEAAEFYLQYVIARLSAFCNVWWSIANEYDLVKAKTMPDWDRFFRIVQTEDPYNHLRSIHHSQVIYDHSKPWCTHASLQSYDFEKSAERRAAWNKPIIYDEVQYEGNIDRRWGNLTAEELTRRFWLATVHGVYASHGEVFGPAGGDENTQESSWSDAGRMQGDSGPRIRFLHDLVERLTTIGLNENETPPYYLNACVPGEVYLWYFDYHRPARYDFPLPVTANFSATLIDPFEMKQTQLPGTFTGKSRIQLAKRPYQAVLFRKVSDVKGKPTGKVAAPEIPD